MSFTSAVRIFKILDRIKLLVIIQVDDPKPMQLFEIFEYLLKPNIYYEGTVSQ